MVLSTEYFLWYPAQITTILTHTHTQKKQNKCRQNYWPFLSASLLASFSVSLVCLGDVSSSSRPSSHSSKGLKSSSASSGIGSFDAFWKEKVHIKRKFATSTFQEILMPFVICQTLNNEALSVQDNGQRSWHLFKYLYLLKSITFKERKAPEESNVPASSSASSRHHSGKLSLSSSRLPLPDLCLL